MDEIEKAKKAWDKHQIKRFDDIIYGKNGAIKGQFQATAIADFQSSLISALEKEKLEMYYDDATLEKAISLVKTTLPKNI